MPIDSVIERERSLHNLTGLDFQEPGDGDA